MNRFHGSGLYILDEPESALSPSRQMTLVSRLHRLVEEGAQFVIATHSPIVLSYPNALIYEIREYGCEEVAYEDTDTYAVTKHYLNSYHTMLELLLE